MNKSMKTKAKSHNLKDKVISTSRVSFAIAVSVNHYSFRSYLQILTPPTLFLNLRSKGTSRKQTQTWRRRPRNSEKDMWTKPSERNLFMRYFRHLKELKNLTIDMKTHRNDTLSQLNNISDDLSYGILQNYL